MDLLPASETVAQGAASAISSTKGLCSLWVLDSSLLPGLRPLPLLFPIEGEDVLLKSVLLLSPLSLLLLFLTGGELILRGLTHDLCHSNIIGSRARTRVTVLLLATSYTSTI